MNISFKQYLILRKLYKSKSEIYLNPNDKNFIYLLSNKLFETKYTTSGPFTNFDEPTGLAKLTPKGESVYHSYFDKYLNRTGIIYSMIVSTISIILSIIAFLASTKQDL